MRVLERRESGSSLREFRELWEKHVPRMRAQRDELQGMVARLVQEHETMLRLSERYLREYEQGRITRPEEAGKYFDLTMAKYWRDVKPLTRELIRRLRDL